jgi:hypothetical protein
LIGIRHVCEGQSLPIEKATELALIEAIDDEKRQPDERVRAA